MSLSPRERFGFKLNRNDYTIFNVSDEYEIKSENLLSKGKSTPFEGEKVFGKCYLTVKDGKTVYKI